MEFKRLKFNNGTKWEDVYFYYLHCIDDEAKGKLKEQALKKHGVPGGFLELRLGEFLQLKELDRERYNIKGDGSAYEEIFLHELTDFSAFIVETLNSYTLRQTAEEAKASKFCVATGWEESLLIFTRSYFGLHSFTEAENIKVGELLIAKKDAYNTAVFQRELNRIQMSKYKK